MNKNNQLSKLFELLETNQTIFLTGGAGVGKSFLVKNLISKYKMLHLNAIVLGSTGVSAVNVGGVTIHSFFLLGICSDFEELRRYDKNNRGRLNELYKILEKTNLIIIDEISMVSAILFDMIVFRLKSANYKGNILLVGDFFQLPPIIKNKNPNSLFSEEFAFESSSWKSLNPLVAELTSIKRTKDKEFSYILNQIRIGELEEETIEYLEKLKQNGKSEDATYLYGTNFLANQKNLYSLKKLQSNEIILFSHIEFLERRLNKQKATSWINSLPIEEPLILKIEAEILFTMNKWGEYYNGERGVVKEILNDEIVIEKENKKIVKVKRGEFVLSKFELSKNGDFSQKELIRLYQFPIKLAYAVTIHKSQGMSIDSLVCNVDRIFTESQFYVAISRAINPKKLTIEFNGYNFKNYLQRVVRVSPKVADFYRETKTVELEIKLF